FIWAFTELGTPLMFDYYTVTPVQVFWGISEIADNPRPYALVVVMLSVAVGCYLIGKLAFGGRAYAMQSKASVGANTARLTGWRGWLALGAFVAVTLLAVMPHIGVVLGSFSVDGSWYRSVLPEQFTTSHYGEALTHEMAFRSIQNSLMYALGAMVLAVTLGLAISYLVVRVKVRGGWLLDTLAMLPLAVPGLVMAFGYVAMTLVWPFGEGDPLGGMFTVLGQHPNPIALLIVAYAIRRLPYIVRAAAAGLEQTSGDLEEASLNLGAGRMYTIRRVVVPLIMANLIAGGILVFSFAMLEVSDSLVLAQQQQHFPITKAIWEFYNRLGDGPYIASAMGVWGMALLTVTLVGASVLMGKRLGAIFRV
ncbi:MAG: ABC transporter permease subunit, partial [Phycisphaeraceae bacterium]